MALHEAEIEIGITWLRKQRFLLLFSGVWWMLSLLILRRTQLRLSLFLLKSFRMFSTVLKDHF